MQKPSQSLICTMHQLLYQDWWATPQALLFIIFCNKELVFQRKEGLIFSKNHAFFFCFLLLSHNKKKKFSKHSSVKCHIEHSDYTVTRSFTSNAVMY